MDRIEKRLRALEALFKPKGKVFCRVFVEDPHTGELVEQPHDDDCEPGPHDTVYQIHYVYPPDAIGDRLKARDQAVNDEKH